MDFISGCSNCVSSTYSSCTQKKQKQMYLSGKGAPSVDQKLSAGKATTLNPNAAEFVPFALKSPAASNINADASSQFATSASSRNATFDRSESSVSNNSDEEAYQYWRHQLPDDITPDFKVMGDDDVQATNTISFSSLSLNDVNESSKYSPSKGGRFILTDQQGLSPHRVNGNSFADKMRYTIPSSLGEYPSPIGKQIVTNAELVSRQDPYNGNSRRPFLADMSHEQLLVDNLDVNPLEFLASQFPGFATESLAEVYFANRGDLNLTIEMLTQLELQVDRGVNLSVNSKALLAPNLGALDFPALSMAGVQNRSSETENTLLYRSSSSIPSRGAKDIASALRKMAIQDSSIWKYERNSSSETSIGSSRSPLTSGQGRGIYSDRLQNRESAHASPVWLETGAVGNMYSETRDEARDNARVRNAYFEQARQALLIGNKALAKELSFKGHLHNMQMKEAHGKAEESIFHQRNLEMQVNGRERMIDLHGLHVSEAIHVLKRELAVLRNAARSTDQRLLMYICVGNGHHTRGSRTPTRLPTAVQCYLLDEGLDYSEPQPGLLRVVVY